MPKIRPHMNPDIEEILENPLFFILLVSMFTGSIAGAFFYHNQKTHYNQVSSEWECIKWKGEPPAPEYTIYDFREQVSEFDERSDVHVSFEHNLENATLTYTNYNFSSDFNRTQYVIGDGEEQNLSSDYHLIEVNYIDCVKYREIKLEGGNQR